MSSLKFHEAHCWVRADGDGALIGITDHAQKQLKKIIYVGLPEVEDFLEEGEPFGEIESRKTVSELIAPVSGEVIEIHAELEQNPGPVNSSPYEEGWLVRVRLSDPGQLDDLMDEAAYLAAVAG